jgi:hypothetical protein
MQAFCPEKRIKIAEIGDMRKPDYGHCGLICLGCWRINRIFYYNRILGLDPYISVPRNNPEHRFSCPGFDPEILRQWFSAIGVKRCVVDERSGPGFRDQQYELLARHFLKHLKLDPMGIEL